MNDQVLKTKDDAENVYKDKKYFVYDIINGD